MTSLQEEKTDFTDLNSERNTPRRRGVTTDLVILNTAEKLFARLGYDAVSTKQLARDAGVTIGAMYHYFPSKKAVYEEVIRKVFAKKSLLPRKIFDEVKSSEEKLSRLVGWFVGNITSDKSFGLLLQRELLDPRLANSSQFVIGQFHNAYQIFQGLISELLPANNREKAFISLLALCFGYAGLIGKGMQSLAPGMGGALNTPEEIGRLCTRVLLHGLALPGRDGIAT